MADPTYDAGTFGDTHASSASTIVLTPGETATSGQIIVASVAWSSNTITCTPDTGWHSEVARLWDSSTKTSQLFWKVAGGSEPSSYTFTMSSSVNRWGTIVCVDDPASDSPVMMEVSTEQSGGTTVSLSDYITQDNCLLLGFWTYKNTALSSVPSGMSEVGDPVNTYSVSHKTQASAGSTGTLTWTTTGADVTVAHLFVVRNASTTPLPQNYKTITENSDDVRTVVKPSGCNTNDLLAMWIFTNNEARTLSVAPSGWTLRDTAALSGEGKCLLYDRLVTGSEGATFTYTWDSNGSSNSCWCVRIAGNHTTSPFDTSDVLETQGDPSISFPSLTAAEANSLYIGGGHENAGRTWSSPPSSIIQWIGGSDVKGLFYDPLPSSGASGTYTGTIGDHTHPAMVFAIYKAPGGGGGGTTRMLATLGVGT